MAEKTFCSKCGIAVKTKKLDHHRMVCVARKWSHGNQLEARKRAKKKLAS